MSLRSISLAAALAIVLCSVHSTAEADSGWIIGEPTSGEFRPSQLSVGALLNPALDPIVAPGFMFGLPIVDDGFITPINDSIYLDFGAFLAFRFRTGPYDDDLDIWFIPEVGPRWNFHLREEWTVYGAIRAGWAIPEPYGLWIRGVAGMDYEFANNIAVRVETTGGRYVAGAYGGITFIFK